MKMFSENHDDSKTMDIKLVLIGKQNVGKTALAMRYLKNSFSSEIPATIAASFFTCTINTCGYHLDVEIWDTAGQERFRSMAPMFYRDANAAFLQFDISSSDSFTEMQEWAKELYKFADNDDLVVCIVGSKLDLAANRETTVEEAEKYARSIDAQYFETSAKTNHGIGDLFMQMAISSIQSREMRLANESVDKLRYDTIELKTPITKRRQCCS